MRGAIFDCSPPDLLLISTGAPPELHLISLDLW